MKTAHLAKRFYKVVCARIVRVTSQVCYKYSESIKRRMVEWEIALDESPLEPVAIKPPRTHGHYRANNCCDNF